MIDVRLQKRHLISLILLIWLCQIVVCRQNWLKDIVTYVTKNLVSFSMSIKLTFFFDYSSSNNTYIQTSIVYLKNFFLLLSVSYLNDSDHHQQQQRPAKKRRVDVLKKNLCWCRCYSKPARTFKEEKRQKRLVIEQKKNIDLISHESSTINGWQGHIYLVVFTKSTNMWHSIFDGTSKWTNLSNIINNNILFHARSCWLQVEK